MEGFSVPTVVQDSNGKPLYPGGALQHPLGRFMSRGGGLCQSNFQKCFKVVVSWVKWLLCKKVVP